MRASGIISNGHLPDTGAMSLKRTCISLLFSLLGWENFLILETIGYSWKAAMSFFTHHKGSSRHSCNKLHLNKGEALCDFRVSKTNIQRPRETIFLKFNIKWMWMCDWTMACDLKKTYSRWGRDSKVYLLRLLLFTR